MLKLLMIADDFTGAMDTGVQFSTRGIRTLVTVESDLHIAKIPSDVEVLVVDLEVRHIAREQACSAVSRLVEWANEKRIPNLYVKVDSTLRGNIGSTLESVAKMRSGVSKIVFAPAFPAQDRVTIDGNQYVNNKLLAETEVGQDPFTPVTSSFVPEIIAQQTTMPSAVLEPSTLAERLDTETEASEILVVNAAAETDLITIAKVCCERNDVVLAGSAGLAACIADQWSFSKGTMPGPVKANRVLIVCGSLHSRSFVQAQQAIDRGIPYVVLEDEQKKQNQYLSTAEGQKFVTDMTQILQEQQVLMLRFVSDVAAAKKLLHENSAATGEHIDIAQNVGKLISAIVQEGQVDTVIVFGGDTLYGIVTNMQISGLLPQKEIVSGVVQSRAAVQGRSLQIISKAGGFGEDNVLTLLLDQIQ